MELIKASNNNKLFPKLRFKKFNEAWNLVLLDDVATRGSGHTPSKSFENYYNGGIKWVSLADSKKLDNGYIEDTEYKISLEGIKKSSAVLHPKESVLLSRDAGVGKSGVMKTEMAVSQHFIVWQGKENVLSNWFLYNILQILKPEFERIAIGSTIKTIGLPYFKKLKIAIPPYPEQQKIASFLAVVDEKIQQLTRKKELLEQYKKGVMQQLFWGKLRFKDEKGKVFPNWVEKRVDQLFKVTRGNVLAVPRMSKNITDKTPYPVYSSQTKENGLTGYYDEFLFEDSITWTTDGANAGEVNFRKGKFYCTNVCGVLISEEGFSNQCIAQILNSVSRKYVSYVGNPKLMNNVMAVIKIIVPTSVEEQKKIANYLCSIDTKIEIVNKQITQTQTFKKGLLQQMFV